MPGREDRPGRLAHIRELKGKGWHSGLNRYIALKRTRGGNPVPAGAMESPA